MTNRSKLAAMHELFIRLVDDCGKTTIGKGRLRRIANTDKIIKVFPLGVLGLWGWKVKSTKLGLWGFGSITGGTVPGFVNGGFMGVKPGKLAGTIGLKIFQVASIIFVDSPVGTGFSYSISSQGHQTGDFKKTSKQLYQFLTKWMFDHPEFLNNHFYVAGDSYSGKIVPLVAKEISNGNEAGNGLVINLKGYLLGNPVTDLAFDRNKIVPFCHGMGLIPDELYESLKRSCGGNYIQIEPTNVQCLKDMQSFHKCISGLNPYQILEPLCVFVSSKPKEMVGDRRSISQNYYKILDPQPPIPAIGCRNYGYLLAYYWTNDIRVQNALHIQKVSNEKWQRCKYDLPYLFQVQSSIPYHAFLSKKGYPSLIYSGDHDMVVPFLATEAWIKSLNYSVVDEWRSWIVDGQIGGYTRTYSNHMTYATVKAR
ncbi:hypothetical protein NE237_018774 [Protea cynaroides]|uniref:Uncharacterized protein n=1 Tax=Protea cynaroides TaxID=273540 RepID=A0A9Q0QP87_9MAGN|nr:hypothetical protein NE237_018774 [Protea cynaroides]